MRPCYKLSVRRFSILWGDIMINTDDSSQFIAMLTGKPDTEVTFQTFSDSSTSGKELNRVVHGSLSEHVEQLSRLNDRGAGVFVMVNEGDRKGRRAANVIAVRAAFVDLDDAPLTVLVSSFVPPHIVIESSPNRYHAYWRVTGCPVPCKRIWLSALEVIREFAICRE